MSSPPNCARAVATARRAASGALRSPATVRTSWPAAPSSWPRSPSAGASRSARTSLAPARPNPQATACPIWPTRPTPVTSAILPPNSSGMGDDVIHVRGAAFGEADGAVALDHVDGALDGLPVVLQGMVGARDRAVGIREERKVEAELLDVGGVAGEPRGDFPERPDARLLVFRHLVAHGGEMAVSPRGGRAPVEDQGHVFRLEQVGKAIRRPVGGGGGEHRRPAADRQEVAHGVILPDGGLGAPLRARRCSSRSSPSSGTSRPPRAAWASPSSVSPCQSRTPATAV